MVSKGVELPETATQAEVEAVVGELAADPVGARHPRAAAAARPPRPGAGARAAAAREGRRRAHRALDGPARARLARSRAVHTARCDAPARSLRRRDVGQAGRRGRPLDAGRAAGAAAARPQGCRRHGRRSPTRARPTSSAVCREADIIIAAAGQARMITAEHVKPGAAVVDVGVSRSESGIVGDVDFDAVQVDRRRDHADAGRHRADDDRLPAREHAQRGEDAGRRRLAGCVVDRDSSSSTSIHVRIVRGMNGRSPWRGAATIVGFTISCTLRRLRSWADPAAITFCTQSARP